MDGQIGSGVRSFARGEELCEAVIEACWLTALLVVPVFFNPFSGRIFEPDRAVVLELVAGLGVTAWLAKVAGGGRPWRPLPSGAPDTARRLLPFAMLAAAAALAVSSILALEPRISWWGSFTRGFGAVTQLSLLALLALLLGHLRRSGQRRRLLFAAVMGSVPVCLYGLLQAAGNDPVPWARAVHRVHASLGNPIFLGAYLVVVVFLTLAWLAEAAPSSAEWTPPARRRVAAAAGAYVLVLQVGVVALTQSRGPFLALAGGAAVLAVLALPPSRRRGWRRLALPLAVAVAVGLAAVAPVVLPVEKHNRWLGRLTRLADADSGSARVRLLTWQGVVRALDAGGPGNAGGRSDPYRALRPVVGWGPEMVLPAAGGFMPAELAAHEPGRAADRTHNEVFEQLVTGGALGLAAWLVLWAVVLEVGLSGLGVVPGGRGAWWFRVGVTAAAAAGALGARVATGSWSLSGPGAGAGLVGGVLVSALVGRLRRGPDALRPRQRLVLGCLVAALVTHLLEVQVGIAVVASRLVTFAGVGLLVAESCAASDEGSAVARPAIVPGLVAVATAAVGMTLVYGIGQNPVRATSTWGVVLANTAHSAAPSLLALTGLTLLIAVLLTMSASGRRPLRAALGEAMAAGTLIGGFLAVHAGRLARDVRLASRGAAPESVVGHVAEHFVLLLAVTACVVLALAAVLARDAAAPQHRLRRPWRASAASAIAGFGLLMVLHPGIADVSADTAFKGAAALAAAGRPGPALRLAAATRAAPPTRWWKELAAAQIAAAVSRGTTPEIADVAREECREALAEARRLAPWSFAATPRLPDCASGNPPAEPGAPLSPDGRR